MTEADPPTGYGAQGRARNFRKFAGLAVVVVTLVALGYTDAKFYPGVTIFSAMIVLVAMDLVLLWRGDLDYTHFQSRSWSYRFNGALMVVALVGLALSATGRI